MSTGLSNKTPRRKIGLRWTIYGGWWSRSTYSMTDVTEGNPNTVFPRNWARRLCKLMITLTRLFIQLISILGLEGFVDQVPEVDELVKIQVMTKDTAKSLSEPCLFLGIGGYFFFCITC